MFIVHHVHLLQTVGAKFPYLNVTAVHLLLQCNLFQLLMKESCNYSLDKPFLLFCRVCFVWFRPFTAYTIPCKGFAIPGQMPCFHLFSLWFVSVISL